MLWSLHALKAKHWWLQVAERSAERWRRPHPKLPGQQMSLLGSFKVCLHTQHLHVKCRHGHCAGLCTGDALCLPRVRLRQDAALHIVGCGNISRTVCSTGSHEYMLGAPLG